MFYTLNPPPLALYRKKNKIRIRFHNSENVKIGFSRPYSRVNVPLRNLVVVVQTILFRTYSHFGLLIGRYLIVESLSLSVLILFCYWVDLALALSRCARGP